MLNTTEVIPITKNNVNMLENCLNTALYEIFRVNSSDAFVIRQYLDIPRLQDTIETRKVKFMDKLNLQTGFNVVTNMAILYWF